MQWELYENTWRRNYGYLRKKTYYEILSYLKTVEKYPYSFFVKTLPRNNSAIVDKVREMSDRMSIYILL